MGGPQRSATSFPSFNAACVCTKVVVCVAVLCGCKSGAQARQPDKPTREVTFNQDIAPIIFERCSSCHHPGEAAPFSLLTYEDVRARARQIVEVARSGFMPPWLPQQGADEFMDARRLTSAQLQTLDRWVAAKAPRGDASDLPSRPTFVNGWQAGQPDLVLESPAYSLSAEGRDVFRNFVVPVPLDAPRWVESIELRPQNPRVTHHARLGVDTSYESIRRDAEDPEPGYAGMAWGQDPDGQLIIWAPGMVARPGTPGVAWRLRPKTVLVLHTHMQPSGKTEIVKFRIGIHFAQKAPAERAAILRIGSRDIDIPPGDARHVVTDQYTLPIDVDVKMLFPHAHSLCQQLNVVAEQPDGQRKTLVSIEHFDEKWHDNYRYVHSVHLPRGTRLLTKFIHDNTEQNLRNRNHPPRRVVYGSNADDEMADVYLQVMASIPAQRAVLMEHFKRYELQSQIVGFRNTLEQRPDDPWSQEGLATCYVRDGKPGEAVKLLERRLKKGPLAVFPLVSLGVALWANSEFARSEAEQRRAIALDKQYPLAWFGLAKALDAQKKIGPAEEAYRQALELAPDFLDARVSLADLLVARGQIDAALKVCSAGLNDSPEIASLYLKLGEITARQRAFDKSLEYFEGARRLAPYTHPPKVLLALSCIQLGDDTRALKLLREAGREEPEHPMPLL